MKVANEIGSIQDDITELSVLLFKTNELLSQNAKLQRDGYHAAWINHKDLFIEAANDLKTLSSSIIDKVESMYENG